MNKKILGNHYIIDLYNCDSDKLKSVETIEEIMVEAGIIGNLTVVKKCFHQFKPYGVSGVLVLKESHFTIHTWYEYNYASIDLFLCDTNINVDIIIEYLKKVLGSSKVKNQFIERGVELSEKYLG